MRHGQSKIFFVHLSRRSAHFTPDQRHPRLESEETRGVLSNMPYTLHSPVAASDELLLPPFSWLKPALRDSVLVPSRLELRLARI